MTRSRQTADWGSRAGLAKIVPSSVAVGSGTGSADSLGTVTFSGASSVSLNTCFSSTYKNYKTIFSITASTTDCLIRVKLRASGTDNSDASYMVGGIGYTVAGVAAATYHSLTSAGWLLGEIDGVTSGAYYGSTMDIVGPQLTQATTAFALVSSLTSAGSYYGQYATSTFIGTNSFDGLSFIATAGTITGSLSVYGYN